MLPWQIRIQDWTGARYAVGGEAEHWCGEPLVVTLETARAARKLLSLDAMGFLDRFLDGEVELDGNLYILSEIRRAGLFPMTFFRGMWMLLRHRAFQSPNRARKSVKAHYDVPQEALDLYLDRTYRSYSCAMFDEPQTLDRKDLVHVGRGKDDPFDSLERAQWRKFDDAIDFVAPEAGETLLDVGCGYGGQLEVALEREAVGKIVGWTHSSNQARLGSERLARFDRDRWELHEGDYRQEERVFDHVTSTGMISHVGPRGLVPYVRSIRARIKKGGRYLHHALMVPFDPTPHDLQVGLAFNKEHLWPGFRWFTLGEHVQTLERNGSEIRRTVNLSRHYAKTTAAWYERMMLHRDEMVDLVGEKALRAERVFLAGISGSFTAGDVHVYRVYCDAV